MRKTLFGLFLAGASILASSAGFAAEETSRYLVKFTNSSNVARTAGHAALITSLQKQLDENLAAFKFTKSNSVRKLWAGNAVAVNLTAKEAALMAKKNGVESVSKVEYKKYIDLWEPKTVKAEAKIQWSILKVKAPEVWNTYKIDGTGIVVGHLDTGVFAEHPLLKGKVIAFKDFIGTQEASYDDQGHGTHTAGSIAGAEGVGVAPGAKLIVGKVFDKNGGGDDEKIMLAMQWMLDPDGNPETKDCPQLVSNSWGSDDVADRKFWDIVNNWVAAGMVPVFAAGNSGPSGKVGTPGNFPHSWAVAATNDKDGLAWFSSVGPTTWDGVTYVKPDIAAPGLNVISCSHKGGLVSNMGTSMACPHVAGLAALMLQANPKLTIDEVRQIGESTAIDLGTPGKDNKFGSGRFDAKAALDKVMAPAGTIDAAFDAFTGVLAAEQALVGIQANSPLAAPLAKSLVQRTQNLDEGEFNALLGKYLQGPESIRQILKDAQAARRSQDLHK